MLKVIIGSGNDLPQAVSAALAKFNEETTERRTFQQAQIYDDQCLIWYIGLEPLPVHEEEVEHWYIGSTDIDPNDPSWRDKWEQNIDQLVPSGIASVASPEGSGATETSNE